MAVEPLADVERLVVSLADAPIGGSNGR